jgi:Anti-sigma-K factor rskA
VRLLRHDLHTLTGVYALDAVDGAERDRFEHHLRRCRPCGNEVRGLAETATTLAMAVAMPPPARLKQRVMNAVGVTRQVPPTVDHRRRGRWRFRAARSSSWVPRLATAVAAVSLAVAVAFGILQISTQHQLNSAREQNQAIAAVIAAPDARIVTQATSAGGTGSVVVSRAEAKIVFTSAGLPALPATEVYELWLIGPPRIRPAGLLPAPSAGKTAPVLASGLAAGDKVGLTVEPAGGTRMPTTTPILLITLPA